MRDNLRPIDMYAEVLTWGVIVYGNTTIAIGQKALQNREMSLELSVTTRGTDVTVSLTRLWAWPHF